MQQGRVVQQFAQAGIGRVQAPGAGAVEQFQSQGRHVAGMFFLETAEAGQTEHACFPRRQMRRGARRGQGQTPPPQVIDENAVLQAAAADAHLGQAQFFHDGLKHGGSGHDDVGSVGIDARQLATFFQAARA